MSNRISVVINTFNEEKNIERAINSVRWADEVIVCDMYSEDRTVTLAKKLGAKVVYHKKTRYVEPARNFTVSEASGDWILVLDADEEIPESLSNKLQEVANNPGTLTNVQIPRKNIIFGSWMKASFWWPDTHIRFFKKGTVIWNDKIHSKPEVKGEGLILPSEEALAIVHHHYSSVFQFIERMNRYTDIQADELKKEGYKFKWTDLVDKPLSEFLGRYFANKGFKDGLHGLSLSLLQAFSFLVVYLKLWEMDKFEEKEITLKEARIISKNVGKEVNYWLKYANLSKNPLVNIIQRAKNKIT